MSIDPFGYRAEDEPAVTTATSVHHARAMLDQAAERKCWTAREGYLDEASTALRDAVVGHGLATLAVNDTLGRIATALEMVAKIPAAIDLLASHVTAEGALLQAELRDTRAEVVDLRSSVETGGEPIAAAIRAVAAAVDTLSQAVEPQPRWWQFGLRRAARRQQAAVVDEGMTASQADPEVQPR